jgi:transitional endoplasmic reticulum ATPase
VNNNVADLEDLSIYFQGLMLSELSSIMQKIEFCQFTDPKYRKKIAAIASSQKVNQGIPEELSKISWSDIAGLEDVKKRIEEMTIWPLKYPSIFEKNGIKPPKGILLCGPPGCGKTLIAKAIAGETLSRLFSVRISDAIKSHVGESEKFVSNLFERAKEAAPSVIFLDEFQAIFTSRESSSGSSSDKQITSQLMIEMDKLQFSNAPIVVLAATNVADAIDPAFKRPGRFDVIINVGLPDLTARKQLFMNLSRKMKFASNFDLQLLADLTEGSSGAQIKNLCQLAGLRALRRDPLAEHILVEDFMAELGRINALK